MDDNRDIFSSSLPEDPEKKKLPDESENLENQKPYDDFSDLGYDALLKKYDADLNDEVAEETPVEQPAQKDEFETIFSSSGEDEKVVEETAEETAEETVEEDLDLNSFSSDAGNNSSKNNTKKKFNFQKFLKAALTIMLVGIITVSIVFGTFFVYVFTMIDGTMEDDLNNLELKFTTAIYVKDEATGQWVEYQRLHGEFNRIWKPYNATEAKDKNNTTYDGIPQQLVNAFIAVEDKRFESHYGVDWKRTFGAVVNTVIPIYSSKQGGSTITQQLVKNLTDDRDQSAMRKVREIMRARYLENHYSKDTIIECYLNTIPLGHGLYGVEVAANYYFGKSVNDLTLLECASLASITKAPSYYAPDDEPKNNKDRRETVLALMLQEGYITQAEHDAALKEEFKLVASREQLNETEINNYFVDALITQVTQDLAKKYNWDPSSASRKFYTGGYKIYATLDPKIQSAVDEVYSNAELYGIIKENDDGTTETMQGAITVVDYYGRVKGMAGGIGAKTENMGFNRAIDAIRQPGSSMKPLSAYALAIQRNAINYSTMVNDTKREYNVGTGTPWSPKNWYDNGYLGMMTVEKALRKSVNTVPVELVYQFRQTNESGKEILSGPQVSFDFVTKTLGITTLTNNDINLSPLGMGGTNGGFTTMEAAAAYAIFGNGGKYYEPTLYYAVYDQHNEKVLSNEELEPTSAISEDTATIMNKLLQQVIYSSDGTGKKAKENLPENLIAYAKTGTTNDNADQWFSGGTPYYAASAWCGYDTPTPVADGDKTKNALMMWCAVMTKIHEGLETKDFSISRYAVDRFYCTETGLLATDACPSRGVGWYRNTKGGLPSVCSTHAGTQLDSPKVEAEKEAARKEEEAKKEQEAADGEQESQGEQETNPTPET